jgi:hypothetical protein
MSSFRIRPHFRQTVDWEVEKAQEQLVGRLKKEGGRCVVLNFPGYVTLRVPDRDQHFWSPQLTLSLEPTDDGRTMIQGIYGPNTNVWAMYLYGYLLVGTMGIFAAMFGVSQWLAGTQPWALWILAGLLFCALAFYLMAQLGQKLGARQTFELHQEFESAIGRTVEIH